MSFCSSCGTQLEDGAVFCSKCGASQQPGSNQQSSSAASAPPANGMKYQSYSDVPWYRKNWFAIACFFLFMPALFLVTVSGDVFYEKKGSLKKYTKPARVFLIIYSLLATLGFMSQMNGGGTQGDNNASAASSDSTPAAQVVVTTPEKLYQAYNANEVAEDNRLKGKTIQFTAPVKSIDKDFTDSVILHFDLGPSALVPMNAELKDDQANRAANLRKGQVVTLRCDSVQRTMDSPSADGCVFYDPKNDNKVTEQKRLKGGVQASSRFATSEWVLKESIESCDSLHMPVSMESKIIEYANTQRGTLSCDLLSRGDIDGDGHPDTAVVFHLEGPCGPKSPNNPSKPPYCGNAGMQYLVIDLSGRGLTHMNLEGRTGNRWINALKPGDGFVDISGDKWVDGDAACCSSGHFQARLGVK